MRWLAPMVLSLGACFAASDFSFCPPISLADCAIGETTTCSGACYVCAPPNTGVGRPLWYNTKCGSPLMPSPMSCGPTQEMLCDCPLGSSVSGGIQVCVDGGWSECLYCWHSDMGVPDLSKAPDGGPSD